MKSLATTTAALTLAAILAGCGQSAQEGAAESTTAAPTTSAAPGQAAPAVAEAAKTAKGTGTVTAVDAAAGTITLNHGAIPEVNWPPMTMAFKAPAETVQQVKVGDKVAFDLRLEGNSGEITAIQKQ